MSTENESIENMPYQNIAAKVEDQSFRFESSLGVKKQIYPLSNGRTFYVSASGSSANNGLNEISPLGSIADVNKLNLQPGDSVLFKKGDKFEGGISFENLSGNDDNVITFASYGEGSDRPVIKNAGDGMHFESCSNIVVRDLQIEVVGLDRGKFPGDCRTGIIFNYNYATAKYRNIYVCNNVVKGDSTSSNIMGISISSMEKTFDTSPSDVLTNCYVYNNEVFNLGRSGIHSGGWLRDEKINQNNGLMTLYRNFYFNNNIVHNVGCIGIYITGCTNSTINRNYVYDTGVYNENQIMEGECGIMALNDDTCEIKFNECFNIYDQKTGYDAMGIDIDWNTTNVDVQYNYCHDCQGTGVGTMANQNSFIRNNRLINNRGETNHCGQIQITNFTSFYAAVKDDMHAVKNLLVDENLLVSDIAEKSLFNVRLSNGHTNFENDIFSNNRVVYRGDDPNDIYFINVDPALPWYKFAGNKYYSRNTAIYKNLETTDATNINLDEGAKPYQLTKEKSFETWAKRDLNSTYELLNDDVPANPIKANATLDNNKLSLSWTVNKGDIWHYNIYCVEENEEASYLNMIGETKETRFTYELTDNDTKYYIIQPESNQGVYGKALKVKIELK